MRFKRLKWWVVSGAPLDASYLDGWRELLGDEFDHVIVWIRRENEKEKQNPRVREGNIRRLTKLLEKGELDIYPATEEFYLKGYFGDEFDELVAAIAQEIQEKK